jgi:geranylgeranyl pyrophosphate synthase
VADDVLDATSTAEALGKTPSDRELGKSTYVSLFGLETARGKALELVDEAKAALTDHHLEAPELVALANYVVQRSR